MPSIYRSPQEVFASHKPKHPLLRSEEVGPLPLSKFKEVSSLEEVRARQLIDIERCQEALDSMHRDVGLRSKKNRERPRQRHNSKTNVKLINFQKCDFVLIRRAVRSKHKIDHIWKGAKRILEVILGLVYDVVDIFGEEPKRERVHAKRMVLYRPNMEDKEVDESLLKYAEYSSSAYEVAVTLRGLRKADRRMETQIEWECVPSTDEWTWEPIEQVREDLPGRVE